MFWKEDKKANIPMEKKPSSCITENEKPQKTLFKGPRSLSTFIIQLIRYEIVSVRIR